MADTQGHLKRDVKFTEFKTSTTRLYSTYLNHIYLKPLNLRMTNIWPSIVPELYAAWKLTSQF